MFGHGAQLLGDDRKAYQTVCSCMARDRNLFVQTISDKLRRRQLEEDVERAAAVCGVALVYEDDRDAV
eukprot:7324277-Prymnesium_polylepis.2